MTHDPLFIETIKLQGGKLHNLAYHNARANRTRLEVLDISEPLDLGALISIPWHLEYGLHRCRVTYGTVIDLVEFMAYKRRNIQTLKLVDGDGIEYSYKYADRSAIDTLFARRGDCDDILIVKDGLITDTSYANIAFSDGKEWWTPSTPLLAGTKRQQLLDEGRIKEMLIRPSELLRFSHFVIFNAMTGFDVGHTRSVSDILH